MLIDKHIHQNEFRLRVLLTNECNKNCSFCLNDFQDKEPKQTAFFMDLNDCIRAYGQFMKSINETSIITFSGGEPGVYPFLENVLAHAYYYCHTVKVVTNGKAFKEHLIPYVDRWNIHVTDKLPIDKLLYEYRNRITIQIVVTDDMRYVDLIDLVKHYHQHMFLVKLFVDFNSKDKPLLEKAIKYVAKHFTSGVCTRFTGVQVNRGKACEGCDKDCVTLKALWYFPDGTSSTCPQGLREKYDHDSWDETMEAAYAAHKVEELTI